MDAVNILTKLKAVDNEGIMAEHLQESDNKLKVLLAMCLNGMLAHSCLPQNFILSILIPVIKRNKEASPPNSPNYRPITIALTCSKVLESILLQRLQKYLNTTDNNSYLPQN